MGGHVARMEYMRSSYKSLTGIPEGKRSLARPRSRREIISKLILKAKCVRVWVRFKWLKLRSDGKFL
jgi:hypothetical protein